MHNEHKNLSVAFLVYREGLGPIFSSVYVNPADKLSASGFDVRIILLSSLGEFVRPRLRRRWEEFTKEICQRVPGGLSRLPSPPAAFRNIHIDSLTLKIWSRFTFRHRRSDIIHCGASQATCLALDLRKLYPSIKVVYHCWGPEAAEYLYSQGVTVEPKILAQRKLYADYLEKSQARAMRESDVVVCISKPMIRWAKDQYGVDESRILLVPCFVDVEYFAEQAKARDLVRRELGFGDELVVGYCGSMLSWQLSEISLEALAAVRRLRPDTRFLGLTMHQSTMRRLLQKVGFPEESATIMSVPHWDVPRYLAAVDLGIIGRSLMQGPEVVNEISSPIKFGEYLACGTPVLMSEGVGDFSGLAQEEGVGVVMPFHATAQQSEAHLSDFLGSYEKNAEKIRRKCVEVAWRELDINRHVRAMAKTYNKLYNLRINDYLL